MIRQKDSSPPKVSCAELEGPEMMMMIPVQSEGREAGKSLAHDLHFEPTQPPFHHHLHHLNAFTLGCFQTSKGWVREGGGTGWA